jgi:hypothetical protein
MCALAMGTADGKQIVTQLPESDTIHCDRQNTRADTLSHSSIAELW